jgi:PAS domain S-box-containing protein
VYAVKDKDKAKDQLIKELADLRQQVEELKRPETERKREEEALRESEQDFRGLIEHSSDIIVVYDADDTMRYLSPSTERIMGYRPEEAIGKRRGSLAAIHPDDIALADNIAERAMGNPGVAVGPVEMRRQHRDGSWRWFEVINTAIIQRSGKMVVVANSRDITERKRMEEILRKSKEDLEAKTAAMAEVNAALKVLLQHRDEERKEMGERFVSNVKKLILPYVDTLKAVRLDPHSRSCLTIIESNLNEILSPFLQTLKQFDFSPRELQVASLIKDGKTTKEIAEVMGVSTGSVDTYRNKIRRKLNLNKAKVNLHTYLEHLT